MTELITVDIVDQGIRTTDEARSLAYNLEQSLSAITVVDSPATQAAATDTARDAQAFLKRLEASRKAVKAPVLEIGRKIDDLATELASPVKTEMNRVGQMVAKFQTAEAMRVEKERREREERERAAMQAKIEADRKAREAEMKMASDADLEKALEAEQEAKRKEAAMYAELTKPQPTAVKATGAVTRKVLRYEVTDIHALYLAAPHLVKMEPNIMAIKSTCKPTDTIPGLKLWEELDTNFRSR